MEQLIDEIIKAVKNESLYRPEQAKERVREDVRKVLANAKHLSGCIVLEGGIPEDCTCGIEAVRQFFTKKEATNAA